MYEASGSKFETSGKIRFFHSSRDQIWRMVLHCKRFATFVFEFSRFQIVTLPRYQLRLNVLRKVRIPIISISTYRITSVDISMRRHHNPTTLYYSVSLHKIYFACCR